MASNVEDILRATIDGETYEGNVESRVEELLVELKEAIEEGGGGGGGTESDHRIRKDITEKVQNGDFDKAVKEQDFAKYGIFIGDFFIDSSNNYTYYVADYNTFKGPVDMYGFMTDDHVLLLVNPNGAKTNWAFSTPFNGSFDGYWKIKSYLVGTLLPKIKTGIAELTGDNWDDHLAKREMVVPMVDGSELSFTYTSVNSSLNYITIPTESQLYGGPIFSGNGTQQGEGYKKLEIFNKYSFSDIFGNISIWLRSLVDEYSACVLSDGVYPSKHNCDLYYDYVIPLITYKAKGD